MGPSQSALAEELNVLIAGGRVSVTERREGISLYQLEGSEADRLVNLLEQAGWNDISFSDAGGIIPRDLLAGSGPGVLLTADRPPVPEGVDAILTIAGFEALLDRPPTASIVWVEGLTATIDTLTVRYCPWWRADAFMPETAPFDAGKVVRVLGGKGPGQHLGRWVLKAPGATVDDPALQPWRRRAASCLLRSLAQEIELDGRLLFKGPPSSRFDADTGTNLPFDLFATMQSAVKWVFENERELEHRHGLMAAEIARTALRAGDASDLAQTLMPSLEGARIAYGFGVAQQSRETLKALSELRKGVSDDTAKMSETTRTLGAAIAAAVFANIGLIVARLSLPAGNTFVGPAALLLGAVLAVYVATVIGSGWHYIWVQDYLRAEWRRSLYRFLPEDDYSRLVEIPIGRAVKAFWIVAVAGIAMVVLLLAAVWYISRT